MKRQISAPSTLSPSPSAASRALSIPEILLHVLTNFSSPSDQIHLRSLARSSSVARCWRAPAQTLLYKSIDVIWSYTEANKLIDSMEANPALFSLVRSLKVEGYDLTSFKAEVHEIVNWIEYLRECGYEWDENNSAQANRIWEEAEDDRIAKVKQMLKEHKNRLWMKGKSKDGLGPEKSCVALTKFLERLVNLRHWHLRLFQVDNTSTTVPPLSPPLLQILQGLTKLVFVGDSQHPDAGYERCIISACHNLRTLELRNSPRELVLPLLSSLRHLLFQPTGRSGSDTAPILKCATTLETLTILPNRWSCRIDIPPSVVLLRLSHVHLNTSSKIVDRDLLPQYFIKTAPQLRYISVYFTLDSSTCSSALQQFRKLIPLNVNTLDATLIIYQNSSLGYVDLVPEVKSEMLLELVDAVPESVKKVRISLPQTEHDVSELRTEAKSRGISLEVEFGYDMEKNYENEVQRDRMMADWRADRFKVSGN